MMTNKMQLFFAYLFIPNQLYMELSSISSVTPASSNIGGQYQKL